MREMKRQLTEDTDWRVTRTGVFVCPCGNRVEDDGCCPNGHESPMVKGGYI